MGSSLQTSISPLRPAPALACLCGLLLAAQDAPPDMRTLRGALRQEVLAAALPVLRQHAEDLTALEQKRATAQDFAGAMRARDERLKVEREAAALEHELSLLPSKSKSGPANTARIELKTSEAALTAVRLEGDDKHLTGWEQSGASAVWKLPNLPPGGYEVLLTASGQGGEVHLQEAFYTLTAPAPKGNDDKPVVKILGTLRVREGGGQLTLRALPPEKCAGWRVHSLVLVPALAPGL